MRSANADINFPRIGVAGKSLTAAIGTPGSAIVGNSGPLGRKESTMEKSDGVESKTPARESDATTLHSHTPGTWRFDPLYQGSALVQILNDEHEPVDACIECHSSEKGRTEDEANARLCAAAPKLLQALEEIAHHEYCEYGSANPEPYRVGITDGHRRAAIIARGAIARITENR